jgi:hypothetical protein
VQRFAGDVSEEQINPLQDDFMIGGKHHLTYHRGKTLADSALRPAVWLKNRTEFLAAGCSQ